jgi:hypothetical protein
MLCLGQWCTTPTNKSRIKKMISLAIFSNRATIQYEKWIRKQTIQSIICIGKKIMHSTYHYKMCSLLPSTFHFPMQGPYKQFPSLTPMLQPPFVQSPLLFVIPHTFLHTKCQYILNLFTHVHKHELPSRNHSLMILFNVEHVSSAICISIHNHIAQWLACHIPPQFTNACSHSYKDLLSEMFFTCLLQILFHFSKPLYGWFQNSPQLVQHIWCLLIQYIIWTKWAQKYIYVIILNLPFIYLCPTYIPTNLFTYLPTIYLPMSYLLNTIYLLFTKLTYLCTYLHIFYLSIYLPSIYLHNYL